ncbi:hypothetical protein GQ600_382 [Phytophthora cactorum]|nr:hypothetical protein GQ600_382 [Phytophthora cactorum]
MKLTVRLNSLNGSRFTPASISTFFFTDRGAPSPRDPRRNFKWVLEMLLICGRCHTHSTTVIENHRQALQVQEVQQDPVLQAEHRLHKCSETPEIVHRQGLHDKHQAALKTQRTILASVWSRSSVNVNLACWSEDVGHVSIRSFKSFTQALVPLVEELIRDELPQTFAVMLGGWKDGTTHYVAIFAVYMKEE